MKIDLLKIVEDNKKIDELRAEAKFKQEINELIAAVVRGEKEHYINSKEVIEKLNLKYTKNKDCTTYFYMTMTQKGQGSYIIPLTKENIKKIQKYVNEED